MNLSQSFLGLIGRIAIAALFIAAGVFKFINPEIFAGTQQALEGALTFVGINVPAANILEIVVYLIAALEILAALFILSGFLGRLGALYLAVFTIATALLVHLPGYMAAGFGTQAGNFELQQMLTNFAIAGGLLFVLAAGTGSFSLFRRKRSVIADVVEA